MYEIFLTERFKKELKKVSHRNPALKNKIAMQLKWLMTDMRHKSLRIHKLSGSDNYSLSVDMSVRIIFSIKDKIILCLRIGTHEDVY